MNNLDIILYNRYYSDVNSPYLSYEMYDIDTKVFTYSYVQNKAYYTRILYVNKTIPPVAIDEPVKAFDPEGGSYMIGVGSKLKINDGTEMVIIDIRLTGDDIIVKLKDTKDYETTM